MTRFLPDSRRSSAVSVNPGGAGTPPRIPDRTGDPGSSSDVCGDDSPVLCGLKPVLELLEKHPERIDALWLRKGRRSPETQRILDLCRAAGIRGLQRGFSRKALRIFPTCSPLERTLPCP